MIKRAVKIAVVMVGLGVVVLSWPAYHLYQELQKARSEDPLVWEEDIRALEATTRGLHAPGTAVVFVGSSSIRLWDTLAEDMSPITVIQHGFGGAKLNDVLHYADRLVTAYQPHAVVVFAGTNDIHPGATKPPATLLATYQAFVARIRTQQPQLPVFYIGITPSLMRWEVWSVAQSTNQLINEWTARDNNLHFIDTGTALLGSDGQPEPDNFIIDGLHLSARGYQLWAGIIRQRLLGELGEF